MDHTQMPLIKYITKKCMVHGGAINIQQLQDIHATLIYN
jgi:hypothetical protein